MSVPKIVRSSQVPLDRKSGQMCLPVTISETAVVPRTGSGGKVETPVAPGKMGEFLSNLRHMCQLIEEAGRYGATPAMEKKYRALRSRLASGYRDLKSDMGIELFPAASFHGCGFEMIFSSHSLDGLVRGQGLKTVERLAEIWRTAQSVKEEAS